MIFSLQKRFIVFLLVPVTAILLLTGIIGFFYAGKFMMDQWVDGVRLCLDRTAREITMNIEEKLTLIDLIVKAENTPNQETTQAFLMQKLAKLDGVLFADIAPIPKDSKDAYGLGSDSETDKYPLYALELCKEVGFCAPILDAQAFDSSLHIVKLLPGQGDQPTRRLKVRVRFDSFLKAIERLGREEGGYGCLVTSTGQFLAHTLKDQAGRRVLGDNGDPLEEKTREEIRKKDFGTLFSKSQPPVVAGFYRIRSANWFVVLFSKGEVMMRPIIQFRMYYLASGIACLLLIIFLIRTTTSSVGSAVAALSAAAAQVRNGDFSARLPEDRSDELGRLNRTFNSLVKGLERRELIKQTFGRYMDKEIAEELMNNPDALRLGGEKHTVTIMMSDLRNFTGISEKLEPEQVIAMMNRYFARMITVIERHHGIIVDFFGDSILVFFNGTKSEISRRALDAVHCAMEMQREHKSFVRENLARNLPEILMGIGIHTGEVVVGNIGTESRAKYGIVGSNVNLTDRIQSTASGGKVVISQETYDAIADKTTIAYSFKVCLKGVEYDKQLYEVESVDT